MPDDDAGALNAVATCILQTSPQTLLAILVALPCVSAYQWYLQQCCGATHCLVINYGACVHQDAHLFGLALACCLR